MPDVTLTARGAPALARPLMAICKGQICLVSFQLPLCIQSARTGTGEAEDVLHLVRIRNRPVKKPLTRMCQRATCWLHWRGETGGGGRGANRAPLHNVSSGCLVQTPALSGGQGGLCGNARVECNSRGEGEAKPGTVLVYRFEASPVGGCGF